METVMQAVRMMAGGMVGIFVVMCVIAIMVKVLTKISSHRD